MYAIIDWNEQVFSWCRLRSRSFSSLGLEQVVHAFSILGARQDCDLVDVTKVLGARWLVWFVGPRSPIVVSLSDIIPSL